MHIKAGITQYLKNYTLHKYTQRHTHPDTYTYVPYTLKLVSHTHRYKDIGLNTNTHTH